MSEPIPASPTLLALLGWIADAHQRETNRDLQDAVARARQEFGIADAWILDVPAKCWRPKA